jgi:ATP-dependent exoDNAse (exonuclease V) alpha subunit
MATAPIAHIFCQIMPGPPELDWWHRVLTNPSDSFAGALAVLTAFLVIIGWLQGCQLKRSVEVAKDAAEAAKKAADSAVAVQRAWLKLDLKLLGQLGRSADLGIPLNRHF